MAFPILPGMDFEWLDPEGTPNRRWRARMSREVWQQVVNVRLYGSHPPPPGTPQLFLKPECKRATASRETSATRTKTRRARRARCRREEAPTT